MSERQRETDRAYLASIGYELQPESSILRDATPEPNAWHKPAMEDVVLATPEPSATAQPSEPNVCTCRPADSNIWDCPVHGAPTPSAPQADDVEASGAGVVDETTVRDGFDVLPMEQWTVAELIDYISGDYDYTATELTKRFASLRADRDRLERELEEARRERDAAVKQCEINADFNDAERAKNRRLREALEVYANPTHWRTAAQVGGVISKDRLWEPDPDTHGWEAFEKGYHLAQEALRAPESEDGDER